MRMTTTDMREIRKLLSEAGFRNLNKQIAVRTTMIPGIDHQSLNCLVFPEGEHDLYDFLELNALPGEDVELADGRVCFDVWLRDNRPEYLTLEGQVQVYGARVKEGLMVWSMQEIDHATILRAAVAAEVK